MTKLSDLVDDSLDLLLKAGDVSPHTVTTAVLQQIGDDCSTLKEALETLLPQFVGERIRNRRNVAISNITKPTAKVIVGGYLSPKVKGIRDFYGELMDAQLHVAPSTYRRVADCTRVDLLFAINERKTHIIREQVRVDQFQRLADLLPDDTTKVGKLTRAAVEHALSQAA